MSLVARSELEKEKRRRDILNAAEKLFFSKGYENVSLKDISKEVKFSRSTIYLYFENKEELFFAIVLRGIRIRNEMIKKEVKKVKTGFKKLTAFRKAYYEFAKEYSDYLQAYNYLLSGRFDLANIEPLEYKIEAFANSKLYDEYKKRFEELYIKKLEHSNGNVTPGILTPKFTVSEYLNEITLLRHEMLHILCNSIEQGKKEGTIKPDVNSVEVTVLLTLITTNVDNMSNDLKDLLIIQGINHNKFLADVNDFIDNMIVNKQK
ncbi:MAG: TetR/AcrR family transcriptional regulator [Methanobacterium formicicum]